MPIVFNCECGKSLKTRDEFAGKNIKCPGCGKVAKVPLTGGESAELDLLPLDEPAPPKARPPVAAVQTKAKSGPAKSPPATSSPISEDHCPKCGSGLLPTDVVCLRCGTQVGRLKGRQAKSIPFYQVPLFRLLIAGVALAVIGWVIYNNFLRPKKPEEIDQTLPPSEKFVQKFREATDLESLAQVLADTDMETLGILLKEYEIGDMKREIKALQSMVILAYCGNFNQKPVYTKLSERVSDRPPAIKVLLADLFYLLNTDKPDYELLEESEQLKKCQQYFTTTGKNLLITESRHYLTKFATDRNELVRLKGLASLISLGELKWLEDLGGLLGSKEGDIKSRAKQMIFQYTAQTIDNKNEWSKWWSAHKKEKQVAWYINSLESLPNAERVVIIKQLVKITGQECQYSENATEAEQKMVINLWRDWLKQQK